MSTHVWDASAVLAFIRREPGFAKLEAALESPSDHLLSTVNLAEVASWFHEHGMPVDTLRELVAELDFDSIAFDVDSAHMTGALRSPTRHRGLSLGDRACLALAKSRDAIALTTDKQWLELDIGVRIECIR